MAGRLFRTAGRRLPISRAAYAALAASALLGAAPAVADGEWVVSTSPAPVAPAATPGPQWQVGGAGNTDPAGSWVVSTPAAEPVTPQSIADALTASSLAAAPIPPAPPAAVDPAPVAPQVELDPDAPEVKALAEAEAELETISAELADIRGKIEDGLDEDALAGLRTRETELEEQKTVVAAKVEELRVPVEELRERLEKEAAERATPVAPSTSPFSIVPGLSFAPVSATVPVIDANLSAQLDSYLAGKGSPLAGLGSVFVYQSTAVGLDPRMLVAIAGAETSFGTYGPSQRIHNPFGMGPGIVYPSWEDGIAAAARNLGGRLYKGSNLVTIAQIHRRWAPIGAGNDPTNLNSHWYKNVSRYYSELGGDPNGSVFTDRAASSTAIPVAPGVAPGIQGTVAAPAAYGDPTKVPGGGKNKGPKAVQLAVSFVGVPFVQGAADPKVGFDFAGLVQYAYAKHGVTLPRAAEAQARVGVPLQPEQLAPGDAVFFADRAGRIHHEGLYVGKGYFVHADPKSGGVVMISALAEPFYATQYAGARRY